MAIKNGIRTLLLAQASIASLCPNQTVGGKSEEGVFVNTVRQGFKTPYIVIRSVGRDGQACWTGATSTSKSTIEIDCVDSLETKADALEKAVNDYLESFKGAAGASDTIECVIFNDSRDSETPEGDGADRWRYMRTLVYSVFHK